jgi:hypothetical protein
MNTLSKARTAENVGTGAENSVSAWSAPCAHSDYHEIRQQRDALARNSQRTTIALQLLEVFCADALRDNVSLSVSDALTIVRCGLGKGP